jgi:hypothetical protein
VQVVKIVWPVVMRPKLVLLLVKLVKLASIQKLLESQLVHHVYLVHIHQLTRQQLVRIVWLVVMHLKSVPLLVYFVPLEKSIIMLGQKNVWNVMLLHTTTYKELTNALSVHQECMEK